MEVCKDRVAGKGLCESLHLICFCARCSLYEVVFDPDVDDHANKPQSKAPPAIQVNQSHQRCESQPTHHAAVNSALGGTGRTRFCRTFLVSRDCAPVESIKCVITVGGHEVHLASCEGLGITGEDLAR